MPTLPRSLSLPKDETLATEKVGEGLYIIKDAYAGKYGYFEDVLHLYTPREKPASKYVHVDRAAE